MRSLLLPVAVLALCTLARIAHAGETAVTLPGGIAGTLNLPDGVRAVPAVLMLHGFGSSKDEVGGLYQREAAALAAKGIASLRIDFQGFGKSDGDTGATTIDLQLADAKAATDFLAAQKEIDAGRLGLLGFSLGGGIAMLAAGESPGRYKSLVTWSSVGDFHKDFLAELGQKAFDTATAEGIVGLDLGWRTIALRKAFFDSLSGHALDKSIAAYPGAYLTIAGSKDFSAAYAKGFSDLAKGLPKEAWIVPEADHIYGVLDADQKPASAVLVKTAEWFARTL